MRVAHAAPTSTTWSHVLCRVVLGHWRCFVKRLSPKFWSVPLTLLIAGAVDLAGILSSAALAQQTSPSNNESWPASISSSVKRGFSNIGKALDPKPSHDAIPEDDAVSLKSKGKPGAELFVSVARLYVESGKLDDAEQQYKLALNDKEKPDYLPALLGYAELKERLGQPDGAIQLYQRAVKAYPQEGSVHNNLGLCFARQGRLDEAVAAMTIAIQIAPKNPRYRNNIATVLVDQGKFRDAFGHLRQVHDEAAAYYNMGYLLNKKGQTQSAMQHFSLALRADPSMTAAQRWIEYLQRTTTQTRLAQHPAAGGLRITSEKAQPDGPRNPSFADSYSQRSAPEQTPTYSPPTFSEAPQNRHEQTPTYSPPAFSESPQNRREQPPTYSPPAFSEPPRNIPEQAPALPPPTPSYSPRNSRSTLTLLPTRPAEEVQPTRPAQERRRCRQRERHSRGQRKKHRRCRLTHRCRADCRRF